MPGRQSSAVEAAVAAYRKAKHPNVYRLAAKHKIAPSSLYRAIKNTA